MVTQNGAAAVNARVRPTAEVGSTGLRRFGGHIDAEYDPNLKGPRGAAKWDEMRRNDPDVGAVLLAIRMSLLSVEWAVERGGETPADEDAALFLESCLDDMATPWKAGVLADATTMFPFGWAYLEAVYKLRQGETPRTSGAASSKFDDGRVGWRKVVLRAQASLDRWEFGPNGEILGMWQRLQTGPSVYIPLEKAVLFRTDRENDNPEGISLLRNAYRPYYIKTNVEEIEVIGAERDMTGLPVIQLPVGATNDDKDDALDVLERLRVDDQAGLVLPRHGAEPHQQWTFTLVGTPGAPKVDTDKTIQRCSVAIARSVLAQFLTLGQGRVGSYALSRDMRDLFHLALKGFLDQIEETVNRYLVEPLFRLNDFLGLTAIPRVVHGRMGQRDIAAFVEALTKLATLGMPMARDDWNFVRGEMEMPELPPAEEGDEEESTPEPEPGETPEDVADRAREAGRRYAEYEFAARGGQFKPGGGRHPGGGGDEGHTIPASGVADFLKGSKNTSVTYHATDAKSAAAIKAGGVDITRNKTASLGQGFYTAAQPIGGRAGGATVKVAVRTENPLIGNSTQVQRRFNDVTKGARSAGEARQRMLSAGYDGVIVRHPQGRGSADWVVAFKRENVKVVR